jgi:hypothetical protein
VGNIQKYVLDRFKASIGDGNVLQGYAGAGTGGI